MRISAVKRDLLSLTFRGEIGVRKLSIEEIVMRALLATLALIIALPAFAETPAKVDQDAIQACLDAVKSKSQKQPAPDEMSEKPGIKGRLSAAAADAQIQPESCISIISTPCLQKAGDGASHAAVTECYDKEKAVWDWRLNRTFQDLLKKMDSEAATNLREVQRTWIAWHDATCRQAWATFQGTMANPMQAHCEMTSTGRQAIWVESWIDVVSTQ
jgi:uncharacterized protein YecT (DUF1311 family)